MRSVKFPTIRELTSCREKHMFPGYLGSSPGSSTNHGPCLRLPGCEVASELK